LSNTSSITDSVAGAPTAFYDASMPYDADLDERVRKLVDRQEFFTEKKMFGGIAFLHRGNMCVGIWKEFLVIRIGPDNYDDALDEPHVQEFDFTGKPLRGWIMIDPDGTDSSEALRSWIDRAIRFTETLPAK
jgi:TfoX/Sxy family transcriptional regulator of competence genes